MTSLHSKASEHDSQDNVQESIVEEVPTQLQEPDQEEKSQDNTPKKFIESDAGDGTARDEQYVHGFRLVMCIVSLILCMLLVALDQTITNIILPVVGNKFNAFDKVGWLSSGFILAQAVFLQPFGKLSIIVGRKWTMIVGIVLFEAGSLMCALSNNMNVLIGGRVLAGIGAAGCQGMVFVILTEILPIQKRPMGMAAMAAVMVISSSLGPVIGGLFTTNVTWRWAFYINLPIGGLAIALFAFTFNPPRPRENILEKLKTYDYFGTFLMLSGVLIFLLALTFGGNQFPWNSAAVISCFVLGSFLVIVYCVWNFKYSKNPLIPFEIVIVPQIVAAITLGSAAFAVMIASLIYVAVYFQIVLDKSALSSGLHVLPTTLSLVVSSILSGILVQKTKRIKMLAVSAGIVLPIGAGLLCLLGVDSSFSMQVGLLIIPGLAIGLQMQPTVIGAQLCAPKTPGSTILTTTLITFFRQLLSAIAAALSDAVYTSSLQSKFSSAVKSTTNESIISQFKGINGKSLSSNNEIIKHLTPEAQLFVKKIIMSSITNVFYMCIGFSFIGTIACIFVTNKKIPDREMPATITKEEE